MSIAAIPTMYAGIQFRSRLEAKWAAVFDRLGWKWTYEPCDYNGWIPDFALHMRNKPVLVEVKPALSAKELYNHTSKIEAAFYSKNACTTHPEPLACDRGECVYCESWLEQIKTEPDLLLVGSSLWLDEFHGLIVGIRRQSNGWCGWREENPGYCTYCESVTSMSSQDYWSCIVCGANGKLLRRDSVEGTEAWRRAFAAASNQTQWRSPVRR